MLLSGGKDPRHPEKPERNCFWHMLQNFAPSIVGAAQLTRIDITWYWHTKLWACCFSHLKSENQISMSWWRKRPHVMSNLSCLLWWSIFKKKWRQNTSGPRSLKIFAFSASAFVKPSPKRSRRPGLTNCQAGCLGHRGRLSYPWLWNSNHPYVNAC